MNSFLIILLIEVIAFSYIEFSLWKSIYTPLYCLMIPYTIVVLITILVAGYGEIVDFCFPSIRIWLIGILIFAIPSIILGIVANVSNTIQVPSFSREWNEMPTIINHMSLIIGIVFLWHLHEVYSTSSSLFGSDDFAMDFCGKGLWAHARELSTPLLILDIYYLNSQRLNLIPSICLLLVPHMVYLVKGPVIISILTAIFLKLYSGKLQLNIRLGIALISIGLGVFLLFYMVLPSIGNEEISISAEKTRMVFKHFIHYLTSGTLGYSIDLEEGFPDRTDFIYLITPFANLFNFLSGQSEMISPISPIYEHTGLGETNVRTFFGAIQIRTEPILFIFFTFACSAFTYILKYISFKRSNIFFMLVVFYYFSLLSMGWFEYYFWHLSIIEIPIWTFVIYLLSDYKIHK